MNENSRRKDAGKMLTVQVNNLPGVYPRRWLGNG